MSNRPSDWQSIIDNFWRVNLVNAEPPSRPFTVLPRNISAKLRPQRLPKSEVRGVSVAVSYHEAVEECEKKVAQIVAECKRNNVKYSDSHFELDNVHDCIVPLATPKRDNDDESEHGCPLGQILFPACSKRLTEIFDDPTFYAGSGPNVRDARQGSDGDCWFISSLGSLCCGQSDPLLIQKICPFRARNEKIGVYGFVFQRDGEWISEVIDDKLYLSFPNYDDWNDKDRSMWCNSHSRLDAEGRRKEYRKTFQRNSDALFYGSSANPNETWVPLLEKAFAKAHGDYGAIAGGWQGEGIEDLTGGITTEIFTADILDVDELWTQGLMQVNKEFLFGAGTGAFWNPRGFHDRQGLRGNHSYCVVRATEYQGERLLLIKDPWGDGGWSGPWSDGSKEWTADALRVLDYQFGDNGMWWMSYKTFLQRFTRLSRTRLFTREWNVTQLWTSVQVPWSGEYNDTRFEFTIPEATRAVVVLSKLNDRFFRGLAGQYVFRLGFRLHESGHEEYLIRGSSYSVHTRSASAELDLAAGTYDVFLQIWGNRDTEKQKVEKVVKENWISRRRKLLQMGLSYDIAHARIQPELSESADRMAGSNRPPPFGPPHVPDSAESLDVKMHVTDGDGESRDLAGTLHVMPKPPRIEIRRKARDDRDDVISIHSSSDNGRNDDQHNDHDDDNEAEPWDATCIVGLRVFCHRTAATIKVITPKSEVQDVVVIPDVDDPEKDAIKQGMKGRKARLSGWSDVGELL